MKISTKKDRWSWTILNKSDGLRRKSGRYHSENIWLSGSLYGITSHLDFNWIIEAVRRAHSIFRGGTMAECRPATARAERLKRKWGTIEKGKWYIDGDQPQIGDFFHTLGLLKDMSQTFHGNGWFIQSTLIWQCVKTLYPWWTSNSW